MRDGRRDAARVGRNDPCLITLRTYAHEFGDALAICYRHCQGGGSIRVHGQSMGAAWTCARCGRLAFTPHSHPPKECRECGCVEWEPVVNQPQEYQLGAEISASDFYLGLWAWIARMWGKQSPPFVLCGIFSEDDRARCGDCNTCPRALRRAAVKRVEREYESAPDAWVLAQIGVVPYTTRGGEVREDAPAPQQT